MPKNSLEMRPEIGLKPSQEQTLQLRRKWNQRILDPLAFIPTSVKREGIKEEEAREANKMFGAFAAGFLKQFLSLCFFDKERGGQDQAKIVAMGYGRGYDSEWLWDATGAFLQTIWVDVSDVACEMAASDLKAQYEKQVVPGEKVVFPEPIVICEEVEALLSDPASVGLDLSSVYVWYFSRILGCLSRRAVKAALSKTGETLGRESDPDRRRAIVIVNAFRDDNPRHISHTSSLYSRALIVGTIEKGVGRPIVSCFEEKYMYFDQIYTGLVIKAK